MRREGPAGGDSPCGPLRVLGPDRVGALRLRGAKRRASPKGSRRIAWEAVEGPLRSRARSTADGRVSCPCRPATGVLSSGSFQRFREVSASRAALRALSASFHAAGSLAGPVLLAAYVGGSVWAPSRAFLRRRGFNDLTAVARFALSWHSAVSNRFCTGRPPLWCRRYVPRVSKVRGGICSFDLIMSMLLLACVVGSAIVAFGDTLFGERFR